MKPITYTVGIGLDEAGRGCLAGPVLAAAVMLTEGFDIEGIRDSKLLTAMQRERVFERLMRANADGKALVGIGSASVEEIDTINILQATMKAMHRALHELFAQPLADHYAVKALPLLVDGNYFLSNEFTENVQTIVGGDMLVDYIAAASIVAKVSRDKWMSEIAEKEFPEYGFQHHKGYATKQHREAIILKGTCTLHRKLFVRNVLQQKISHSTKLL